MQDGSLIGLRNSAGVGNRHVVGVVGFGVAVVQSEGFLQLTRHILADLVHHTFKKHASRMEWEVLAGDSLWGTEICQFSRLPPHAMHTMVVVHMPTAIRFQRRQVGDMVDSLPTDVLVRPAADIVAAATQLQDAVVQHAAGDARAGLWVATGLMAAVSARGRWCMPPGPVPVPLHAQLGLIGGFLLDMRHVPEIAAAVSEKMPRTRAERVTRRATILRKYGSTIVRALPPDWMVWSSGSDLRHSVPKVLIVARKADVHVRDMHTDASLCGSMALPVPMDHPVALRLLHRTPGPAILSSPEQLEVDVTVQVMLEERKPPGTVISRGVFFLHQLNHDDEAAAAEIMQGMLGYSSWDDGGCGGGRSVVVSHSDK
jgi:hypothetical protein